MNFTSFSMRFLRMMGEENPSETYPAELIRDAINVSLNAILPYYPQLINFEIASDVDEVEFPAGVFAIEGILDLNSGKMLPMAVLRPFVSHGNGVTSDNDWIIYPSGVISFSRTVPSQGYTAYALSHWTELADENYEDSEIDVPYKLIPAIMYSSAVYCLQSAFSQISQIRAYATRVDSGTPESNPYKQVIQFYQQIFMNEMNQHGPYQRMAKHG